MVIHDSGGLAALPSVAHGSRGGILSSEPSVEAEDHPEERRDRARAGNSLSAWQIYRCSVYCPTSQMPRRIPTDEVDSFLPLPTAVFHILVALADRDRHGYAIMQDVDARTGGKVRLSAGTLYSAI